MKHDDIVWIARWEDGHDHLSETIGVFASEALAKGACQIDAECRYHDVKNAKWNLPENDCWMNIYFGCGHADTYSWSEHTVQWSLNE